MQPTLPPGPVVLSIVMTIAALCSLTSTTHAQVAPLPQISAEFRIDSGEVQSHARARGVIFSHVVHIREANWLRLRFAQAQLGAHTPGGQPTIMRITSIADGAQQVLTHAALRQWQYSSAYFNGDTLLVEIIADPDAQPSHIATSRIIMGDTTRPDEPTRAICGDEDDRVLSADPRQGRIVPEGCTGWLIDDERGCLLTAGHCGPASFSVVLFNVPLSNADGSTNFPPPQDQYPVDPASIQTNNGAGVGNDWAYFGCFANTDTGLTPGQAQGDQYQLASPPSNVSGQQVRITGYGTTDPPVPNEWNAVQKTHVGDFVSNNGTTLQYTADTTGGNSGSPIIHEQTGLAIGIHTHGGCEPNGGANAGTSIDHANLQAALAGPLGVCKRPPPLLINFPQGPPTPIDPAGQMLVVEILGNDGGVLDPLTPKLNYDIGTGLISVPMTPFAARGGAAGRGGELFAAMLPATQCSTIVRYFVSAMTTLNEVVASPHNAPAGMHDTISSPSLTLVLDDNFETDTGWLVSSTANDGLWERGIPVGGGGRGDPILDADGSGQCWLTGNEPGNSDVDGGATFLTSPLFDGSHPDTTLAYWTWLSNDMGSGPHTDPLLVELSDDNGVSWHTAQTIGPDGPQVSGGWFHTMIRLDSVEAINANDQMRMRFVASDTDPQSVVEAAVDGVQVIIPNCSCPGDANDDQLVDVSDLLIVISQWGSDGSAGGDVDDDGDVDLDDLLTVISNWARAC